MFDDKKIISVLSGKKTIQPPIWFMRQAGRYLPEYRELREKVGSFWNLCLNPELASEVTLQPMKRFNFDAAIIFSDILIIPQALGQKVDFLPNHGPKLEKFDLKKLWKSWEEQTYLINLEPTLKALKIVKQQLLPHQALIGFSGAPWTLATYMLNIRTAHGFEERSNIFTEESEVLEKLFNLLARTLR